MSEPSVPTAPHKAEKATRRHRRLPRTRSGRIGMLLLVVILAGALLGPLIASNSPTQTLGIPYSPPSPGSIFGLDYLGRDVLTRALYGGRSVLLFAGIATVAAYFFGLLIGLFAGYTRSWVDTGLMRSMDVLLAFPTLIFILVLSNAFSRSIWAVVAATAVIQMPPIARIVRTATVEQSVRGFVEAAVARGESMVSVLAREILPNLARPLSADIGLRFTWSVLLIASVNFLGLGLQPPASDWGLMVSENRAGIGLNPWAVVVPALLLGALTVGINLLSDSIADTE